MLVSRMTLDKIFSTFQGINVIIETKFDGERIQCHKNDNEIKFYSRNGVDYTYLYGPKFSYLIPFIIKFIPCFIMDFIQYYIFDYSVGKMGSRKDNYNLLNLKED